MLATAFASIYGRSRTFRIANTFADSLGRLTGDEQKVVKAKENFFVSHAYLLGANEPDTALKTTLKAEINEEPGPTLRTFLHRSRSPAESRSRLSTTSAMKS